MKTVLVKNPDWWGAKETPVDIDEADFNRGIRREVTEPISTRRRVSDLAEFVYKRANCAGMAPGLRCAEIASSMSRRAYRPENTRTFSVGNDLKLELSKPAWLLVLQVNRYVEYLATLGAQHRPWLARAGLFQQMRGFAAPARASSNVWHYGENEGWEP